MNKKIILLVLVIIVSLVFFIQKQQPLKVAQVTPNKTGGIYSLSPEASFGAVIYPSRLAERIIKLKEKVKVLDLLSKEIEQLNSLKEIHIIGKDDSKLFVRAETTDPKKLLDSLKAFIPPTAQITTQSDARSVSLFMNSSNQSEFYGSLLENNTWKAIDVDEGEGSFLSVFLDSEKFTKFVSDQSGQKLSQIPSKSLGHLNPTSATSCADSGPEAQKIYSDYVKNLSLNRSLNKYITDRTILGYGFSGEWIKLNSKVLELYYSEEDIATVSKDPEFADILKILSKNSSLYKDFPFVEVNLVVNSPLLGQFFPEAFIHLTGGQDPEFLGKLKTAIDEFDPSLVTSFSEKSLVLKESIFLDTQSDGSILISLTPDMKITEMEHKPIKGDSVLYFNSKPLIDYGKPFLGMLGQLDVNPKDLDESIKALEVAFTVTTNTELKDSAVCSTANLSVIE